MDGAHASTYCRVPCEQERLYTCEMGGVLLGMCLLSSCARVPTGPSVLALPAVGKPMDVFQAEEDGCRAYAQHQTAAGATPRQSRYDIAYSQCMYATGNVIPGVVAPAPPAPSLDLIT
jgi:hypothetical protein